MTLSLHNRKNIFYLATDFYFPRENKQKTFLELREAAKLIGIKNIKIEVLQVSCWYEWKGIFAPIAPEGACTLAWRGSWAIARAAPAILALLGTTFISVIFAVLFSQKRHLEISLKPQY